MRFAVRASGRGRIDVLETAWKNNVARVAVLLQPASRRFVFARKVIHASGPDRVEVAVSPNSRGNRLVAHHRYPVVLRLWITYTPEGGHSHTTGFYGLQLPTGH